MKIFRILVINPGSTSTKISVFENETMIREKVIRHPKAQIAEIKGGVFGQKDFRKQAVLDALDEWDVKLSGLDAIVGRGGITKPIEGGVYTVNNAMLHDLQSPWHVSHAASLGASIARELGQDLGLPCYVVDPVVVDEMEPCARLAGFPGIERRSTFHTLNQKAVARLCAKDMGMSYENGRFVVAHMGGGISVGAHRYGRVVDVNDAMAGEGAFSPERSGGLAAIDVIRMCFSGDYTKEDMTAMVTHQGGMLAYLGTNDLRQCEKMIMEGDEYAVLVLESMAYQIAKDIGAMVAVLEGRVDAIILTGGLAYSNRFTGSIKQRVSLIAPVKVYPGEEEMTAMAAGALRVLRGEERPKEYGA